MAQATARADTQKAPAAPVDITAYKEASTPPVKLDVTVRPIEPKGKLIGFATVTFGGVVTIPDFRVFNGDTGLFVGNPSRPDVTSTTGYRSAAILVGNDIKNQINVAVRDAYMAEVERLQNRAAAVKAEPEKPRIRDQAARAGEQAARENAERVTPENPGGGRDDRT